MESAGRVVNIKDTRKQNLNSCATNIDNLEDKAKNRPEWRATINKGCKPVGKDRCEKLTAKLGKHHSKSTHSYATSIQDIAHHRLG